MRPKAVKDYDEEECDEHEYYQWDELYEECVDPSICVSSN